MPTVTAPAYSAIAGALTGLALWVLQEYAFKGTSVPEAVAGAVLVLVPAGLSGLASLFTRRATAPPPPVTVKPQAHP